MADLDLNLLVVLVALADNRTVSRTALKLGKSQPAVSSALGKLRTYFKDPLFLRVGNVMQPTPRAVAVIESARIMLDQVARGLMAQPTFEPLTSTLPIKLALSDVGEIIFLPAILNAMRNHMPRAAISSLSMPAEALPGELETGHVDLALGYFPDLEKGGFYQQTVFKDTFACLIRANHPHASRKLSIKQFLQLEHAVVRAESRTQEVIERYLARNHLQRRVVLTSPHFASTPIIVAQSDLLVIVPKPLATYYISTAANLRVIELPFEPPSIEIKQFWHRKFQNDPRNRWLRSQVYALFESRRS